MTNIPLYIVSGFLGSGKTTFLKRVLQRYGREMKIGIVQTEFPLSSVDYGFKDYSDISFALLEINRGSASCITISPDFCNTFNRFTDSEKPDIIFLETSGLTNLADIINMLNSSLLKEKISLKKIYTIIDASRFDQEVTFLKSLKNQIRISDVVVINKYEKLNRLESREVILDSHIYKRIENWIFSLNPFVTIIPAINSALPDSEMLLFEKTQNISGNSSLITKVMVSSAIYNVSDILSMEKRLKIGERALGYIRTDSENIAFLFNNGISQKDVYSAPIGESVVLLSAGKANISAFEKLFSDE